MTWIQTVSGRPVDLLDLQPEQIDIEDIAYALAGLNRYTGHTRYTVAQHSVLCAMMLPAYGYAALMHDAHEAYMGDISAPMKSALRRLTGCGRSAVYVLGTALETQVALRFSAFGDPNAIRYVDLRMLQTERLQLLGPSPRPWSVSITEFPPYDNLEIEVWPPERAEQEFLSAFYGLAPTQVLRDLGFPR